MHALHGYMNPASSLMFETPSLQTKERTRNEGAVSAVLRRIIVIQMSGFSFPLRVVWVEEIIV